MKRSVATSAVIIPMFWLLLLVATISVGFCYGCSSAGCRLSEKGALLKFKNDLTDPSNRLASWVSDEDCCRWPPLWQGSSLKNCTQLVTLDFTVNNLRGNLPTWMGKLSSMKILNLHANQFDGQIPVEFCDLASSQVLDLAYNSWNGTIPSCINHFSSMDKMNGSKGLIDLGKLSSESALLVMKGRVAEYSSILNFESIDLSPNDLSGEIPNEVTSLEELQALNLSHDCLEGKIPKDEGDMGSL
ncbi:hypothetical protein NC652_000413 [Populus alba x Populus x berolinensis]|nr:hypothetical protein NC652_000413 [Populus alba x Populus x berolinensis]